MSVAELKFGCTNYVGLKSADVIAETCCWCRSYCQCSAVLVET